MSKITPLAQFGRNVPCKFWSWRRLLYFGRTCIRRGWFGDATVG